MEERTNFLRVGLLILAGVGLLLGLIVFLTGERTHNGHAYETYFSESVEGLEVGAPVKYLGVTLGRVTKIGLVSAAYGEGQPEQLQRKMFREVYVRYLVSPKQVGRIPDTDTAVKSGLRARLAQQGLTGLSYIELDFVDASTYPPQTVPWQPQVDFIPSMPSVLSQVQDAAQTFLARLNKVNLDHLANSVDTLVSSLNGELKDGDLHQTLADMAGLITDLRGALTAADVPGLTADLRQTSGAARAVLQGPDLRRILADARRAAAGLPGLIASLRATASRAGNATANVQQAIGPLLRDATAAAANLRAVTEDLRRYPAQVLLGGPPPRREPAR